MEIGRPQRYAALLLLVFAAQCLWTIQRQPLTERELQYAQCGRALWEGPASSEGVAPLANLGDGSFACRVAGVPLVLLHLLPAQRTVSRAWQTQTAVRSANSRAANLLLHLPFVLFGVWLGGGIWWVARRLYGNEGGFFALALYCFSPEMLRLSVRPNNEILAAWGLYGLVYTAIGVAHAMQGPVRRWRPRIVLLALALGLTAMAHVAAAVLGLLLALLFMLYLARERRLPVLLVLLLASLGASLLLLVSVNFHAGTLWAIASGAAGGMVFSLEGLRQTFLYLPNAGVTMAALTALVYYAVFRRSRYFGNTTPLLVAALLLCLRTTEAQTGPWTSLWTGPWVWALPFVLTFTGGAFADMLESRHRRMYLWLTAAILLIQAGWHLVNLPRLA
jgi:hypothetical protein